MAGKRLKQDLDQDGCLILRGELFWKWRAVSESITRIDSDLRLRSHEVDKALDANPELRKLLNDRASLVQESATARVEYQRILVTLEEHFGFPMKDVSIDDQTGRVHTLEAGVAVPKKIKASSKSKTKTKTRK